MFYFTNEGDLVEKLYGNKVCKNFPNYHIFWKKFVGCKEFKNAISINLYSKLEVSHYSLFFSLAAAHCYLDEVVGNKRESDDDLFRLFEFVETFYMHLGNVNYRLCKFWDILKQITGYSERNLERYLSAKSPSLFQEAVNTVENAIKLRNVIVHGGRLLYWYDNKTHKFFLPDPKYIKTTDEISWDELRKVGNLKIDIVQKAEEDLGTFEQTINKIQQLAIDEIDQLLIRKKIVISRSSAPTHFPGPLGTAVDLHNAVPISGCPVDNVSIPTTSDSHCASGALDINSKKKNKGAKPDITK